MCWGAISSTREVGVVGSFNLGGKALLLLAQCVINGLPNHCCGGIDIKNTWKHKCGKFVKE